MGKVGNFLSSYHHKFDVFSDGSTPPPLRYLLELAPAWVTVGLGAFAFLGGSAVKPNIPDDAVQIAVSQPAVLLPHAVRGFKVTEQEYEKGVDCGGRDPWIGGPRIDKAREVRRYGGHVVFECDESEVLKQQYGDGPKAGEAPLHPDKAQ